MVETDHPNCKPSPNGHADITTFMAAWFLPDDLVSIRPIDTWEQPGKDGKPQKKSKVDFRRCKNLLAHNIPHVWGTLLHDCEVSKTNLFFSVCPRFGGKGQFELAWQIRTVRCLWADLDHCTPDEALQRCEAAGLPRPSIFVNSGHGVHLYWLLDAPYLVDDVGPPPAVLTEFLDQGAGKKKKPVHHYTDPMTKERVEEKQFPTVSAKGQYVQRIIAGMAGLIGGDDTQDLSRLLRLPGSWNRKNQRNGVVPVPSELVECDIEKCGTVYGDDKPHRVQSPWHQRTSRKNGSEPSETAQRVCEK